MPDSRFPVPGARRGPCVVDRAKFSAWRAFAPPGNVYQAKQTGRNRTVADTELAPRTVTLDATPRGALEFF